MRVSLIKSDRVRSLNIPDVASGNFWLTDYDENGKICFDAEYLNGVLNDFLFNALIIFHIFSLHD